MSRSIAEQIAMSLRGIVGGELPVRLTVWDGSSAGPQDAPKVLIRDRHALRRLLWNQGELGAAQAYVTGEIDVESDLKSTLSQVRKTLQSQGISAIKRNPRAIKQLASIFKQNGAFGARPKPPITQAQVRGLLHSVGRDRKAISHHYDIPSDFYALFLDDAMAYSSGYWTSDAPEYGLQDAQRDKFTLVCDKLGLRPGMRLLDIGCGWGSLSLHAAEHYGVSVTGITIAQAQQDFARRRVAQRALDNVDIRVQDYRDLDEAPFDAVVSLEMGEHVGQRNFPTYIKQIHRHLRPGGRALIQQMTRHGKAPGGGPFIESFIAPDMHMRSLGENIELIEQGNLEVIGVQSLRQDYVRTVDAWYHNFEQNMDAVIAMMGEEVARVWRLYLVGGALAFEENRMGVDQVLTQRVG